MASGMAQLDAGIDAQRARRVLPILHTLFATRPMEEAARDE
jgi:hypothetical protein